MAFGWLKQLTTTFKSAADDRSPWEQDRDRMFKAIKTGDAKAVDDIAQAYPDEFMTWKTKDGTPLQVAQQENRLDVFETLVRHGADVNERGKKDWTPLLRAARDTQKDFFDFLVDNGADLDAKAIIKVSSSDYSSTTYTATALHLCIKNDNKDMVIKLLERGADPNVQAHMTWGGSADRTSADYAEYKKKFTLADACKRADKIRAAYLAEHPAQPAAAIPVDEIAGKITVNSPLQLKRPENTAP